jgi:hypothetical protein
MLVECPEKMRLKVVESIQSQLSMLDAHLCRNIEKSIFNYSIDKGDEYKIIKR